MKKSALVVFVLFCFVVYSIHQRTDGSAKVIAPQIAAQTSANSSSSSASTGSSSSPATTAIYKDGQYTGTEADAYYGYIQVQATIQSGKITDVVFLQYPNDRSNSVAINRQAMPYLKQEAIAAQSSNVNIISGATDTSQAFIQSLASALDQAKI